MEYALWPACVKTHSYREQLVAAQEGGFTHLPIGGLTVRQLQRQYSLPAIAAMAKDHGISLGHYDGFTDWAPLRYHGDLAEEAKAVFNFSADECLEICHELGLKSICATGAFQPGQFDVSQLADGFAAFCERAAALGIHVDLEFIPMWGIPSVGLAWDIVRRSSAPNTGVLFDSWHFLRGDADIGKLASLPDHAITCVQLADVDRRRSALSLLEECLRFRLPPGQGRGNLAELCQLLKQQNCIRSIGPEIFSDRLDLLSASEAAHEVDAGLRSVLVEAGWAILPATDETVKPSQYGRF